MGDMVARCRRDSLKVNERTTLLKPPRVVVAELGACSGPARRKPTRILPPLPFRAFATSANISEGDLAADIH